VPVRAAYPAGVAGGVSGRGRGVPVAALTLPYLAHIAARAIGRNKREQVFERRQRREIRLGADHWSVLPPRRFKKHAVGHGVAGPVVMENLSWR